MTARDANGRRRWSFDFQNPPFMTPPKIVADTTVPQAILAAVRTDLRPCLYEQ